MNRFHEARKAKQHHYLTDPRYCQEGEWKNDIPISYYLYGVLFIIFFVLIWNKIEKIFNHRSKRR
jgi:NADH:ubiquinone oxidoreductase subunit 3 (subunit A)